MAADCGHAQPPPGDLAQRSISLRTVPPIPAWFRIGKAAFPPIHFSISDGWRFSRPTMPGTLYLAEDAEACFWEVFWDDLVSRPPGERRLDRAKIDERTLWELTLPRPLQVVDTTDPKTLRKLGAHGGTFSGSYPVCQEWGGALRAHPAQPDGLLYESVRDKPKRCLALFAERLANEAWSDPGSGTALRSCRDLASVVLREQIPIVATRP